MKQKKLLFIEPCFENFGGYFRAFGLAKALSQKGMIVDLLCPSKEKISFKIDKKKFNKNLVRYELPVWHLNFFINGRILRGIISSLFVIFGGYDVIHAFATIQPESIIPFSIAKLFGKKVIFDWDDYWQDSPIYYYSSNLVKKYISYLENTIPKYSKYMTVTSTFLEEKAKALGSGTVLKIINGVDTNQFKLVKKSTAREKLGLKPQEKIILSFGNTYEGDRAYLLLKTFQEIYKKDNTVKLYVNLNPETNFQDLRIKHEIKVATFKNIVMTGFINNKLLPYYIGASDIILFLMGGGDCEKACFPIRIGTYLNGEKVIAINKTKTQVYETLLDYNCAIIGNDPKDLANKIILFMQNQETRIELEKNVLSAKKNLAWEKIVEQLMLFYEKIIKQ